MSEKKGVAPETPRTLTREQIERYRDVYGSDEPPIAPDGQPYINVPPRSAVRDLAATALALMEERDQWKERATGFGQ